jgi:hypothetical protein
MKKLMIDVTQPFLNVTIELDGKFYPKQKSMVPTSIVVRFTKDKITWLNKNELLLSIPTNDIKEIKFGIQQKLQTTLGAFPYPQYLLTIEFLLNDGKKYSIKSVELGVISKIADFANEQNILLVDELGILSEQKEHPDQSIYDVVDSLMNDK